MNMKFKSQPSRGKKRKMKKVERERECAWSEVRVKWRGNASLCIGMKSFAVFLVLLFYSFGLKKKVLSGRQASDQIRNWMEITYIYIYIVSYIYIIYVNGQRPRESLNQPFRVSRYFDLLLFFRQGRAAVSNWFIHSQSNVIPLNESGILFLKLWNCWFCCCCCC